MRVLSAILIADTNNKIVFTNTAFGKQNRWEKSTLFSQSEFLVDSKTSELIKANKKLIREKSW